MRVELRLCLPRREPVRGRSKERLCMSGQNKNSEIKLPNGLVTLFFTYPCLNSTCPSTVPYSKSDLVSSASSCGRGGS